MRDFSPDFRQDLRFRSSGGTELLGGPRSISTPLTPPPPPPPCRLSAQCSSQLRILQMARLLGLAPPRPPVVTIGTVQRPCSQHRLRADGCAQVSPLLWIPLPWRTPQLMSHPASRGDLVTRRQAETPDCFLAWLPHGSPKLVLSQERGGGSNLRCLPDVLSSLIYTLCNPYTLAKVLLDILLPHLHPRSPSGTCY